MNLTHLTDKALLADTKVLIDFERKNCVKILHHLKEIENRKLYSELKYQSLFEYCTSELKLTESSSQRRIVAARLMRDFPFISEKIESGNLSLTNISSAVKYINDNGIKNPSAKKEILKSIENLSKKECDQKLFELSGKDRPKTTILMIKDETFVLLQKAKSLYGQPISQDELIQKSVEYFIEKIEKIKFKQTTTKKSLSPAEVKRVIPAEIKRSVYKRDKKCVRCGSIHNLNYDHRKPYSLGGKSNSENIRLLCFNCNQRSRITAKL